MRLAAVVVAENEREAGSWLEASGAADADEAEEEKEDELGGCCWFAALRSCSAFSSSSL